MLNRTRTLRCARRASVCAGLILLASVVTAGAATITTEDLYCRHRETLTYVDRLDGDEGYWFVRWQLHRGECTFTGNSLWLFVGAQVRIEQREGSEVCITPVDSGRPGYVTIPCEWIAATSIKED